MNGQRDGLRTTLANIGVVLLLAGSSTHSTSKGGTPAISLIPIAAGLSAPTSLEYQLSSDSFVVLARPATPSACAFETVTTDGDRFQFGPAILWPADAPVAVVQDAGDFDEGEVFTSRGVPGQIVRLTDNGKLAGDPWARLPGESGNVSALTFSHGGPFGTELIAGTSAGNIWRVAATGHAVLVASIGHAVTAMVALPRADRHGEAAGKLLAATGAPKCQLLSIDDLGHTATIESSSCVTDLDIVVPDVDAFFTGSVSVDGKVVPGVLKAPATDFEGASCGVLMTHAEGPLATLAWAGGKAAVSPLGDSGVGLIRSAFAGSAITCQPEICGDELDNNGDGDTDEGCEEVCGDGVDNNSNGEVDEGCPEICGDGEDDDGNGLIDDGCLEVCGDGVDNDGDDLVDAPCPEVCDGIDNNQDGVVDEGCPPPPLDAGCTAEEWLSASSLKYWVSLKPDDPAGSVFAFPASGEYAPLARESLRSTLTGDPRRRSGPLREARRLLAVASAALLNATQPAAGYPIDPKRITDQVNAALASGSPQRLQALAGVLDAYDQLGCRLPKRARSSRVP